MFVEDTHCQFRIVIAVSDVYQLIFKQLRERLLYLGFSVPRFFST